MSLPDPPILIVWFINVMITSVGGEELSWRGLALPLLQRRYGGLVPALLLGFVWALWHLSATMIATDDFAREDGSLSIALLRLFVGITTTSVIVTAVYNMSHGCLPLIILFHWLTNLD